MKYQRRRKLAYILSVFVFAGAAGMQLAATAPVHAAEEHFQQAGEVSLDAQSVDAGCMLQNDILFAGHVDKLFGVGDRTARLRAGFAGNRLAGNEKKLYDLLKKRITEVANGERSLTEFRIPVKDMLSQLKYTEKELGGVQLYDPAAKKWMPQKQQQQLLERLIISNDSIHKVFLALLADCPYELYWYDKSAEGSLQYAMPGIHLEYDSIYGGALSFGENEAFIFRFLVDPVYAAGDYMTDTGKTGAAERAAARAREIVKNAEGLTDYQKLTYYCKQICDLTSYNEYAAQTRSPGNKNPWQLIYVFDGDSTTNVVCEGYAKAFQYLCDMTAFDNKDIASYIVSGTMRGAAGDGSHMWNIVHMGSQGNYLVDVTSSDTDAADAGSQFFLTGHTSGDVVNGYGVSMPPAYIFYVYDEDTKNIYSTKELTLNKGGMLQESDVQVYPANEMPAEVPADESSNVEMTVNADGSTAEIMHKAGMNGEDITVIVQKDRTSGVTDVQALVSMDADTGSGIMLTKSTLSQITEAAGRNNVGITVSGKDAAGNLIYEWKADGTDLTAGENLSIYRFDSIADEYIMTDDKTHAENKDGCIYVFLEESGVYQLLNDRKADQVNQAVLKTVKLKKASAVLKKGKSMKIRYNSGLNMENVKSVVYASSKKKVAGVSAKGKITARSAGTAAIKARVLLKNGTSKTLTMKIKVK